MIDAPDFSAFSVKAAISGIRDGAAEALVADREIAAFLGATYDAGTDTYGTDARIYRVVARLPDRPRPFCTVYNVRAGYPFVLSQESENTAVVGISLVWDEFREVLEEGDDRSAEDFFNRVLAVLAADPGLELVPSGAAAKLATGKGLADRLDSAEEQDFTVFSEKDDYVTLEKTLLVKWTCTVNLLTGEPQ